MIEDGIFNINQTKFSALEMYGIKLPGDIEGIVLGQNEEPEFTQEKIAAIQRGVGGIFLQLQQKMKYEGLSAEPFYKGRSGIASILPKVSIDGARQFRGVLLSDLIIAAIVGEGKIVREGGSEGSTGVNVTPSFKDAATYAALYSKKAVVDQETRIDILGRFMAILHLTDEQSEIIESILFSPVVLRFDRNKLEGKSRRREIKKRFYTGSFQNISPYLEINDLTEECIEYIKDWSGIDFKKLTKLSAMKQS